MRSSDIQSGASNLRKPHREALKERTTSGCFRNRDLLALTTSMRAPCRLSGHWRRTTLSQSARAASQMFR